ncbi:GntR family transcriptional regulator [Ruminococcaceae bacterium OttesenSCG-928-I18]|nr:GntR family transcriptional regulator [Ruminococcaceae bacterium OttesenSCG-928-I18]
MKEQSAVDSVIETLLKGVENGTFPEGEALPPQRELCRLFGVSMVAVREAIKVLEGRGILLSRRGSGIYVLSRSRAESASVPETGTYALREIILLARSIWQSSTAAVVQNASQEDLLAFQRRVQEMQRKFGTSKMSEHQLFIYESSFGMNICRLANNTLVNRLMSELLKTTIDVDQQIIQSPHYIDILRIDEKILHCLMQRDTQRALLWSGERDVEIDSILGPGNPLLSRKYHITLQLQTIPQE